MNASRDFSFLVGNREITVRLDRNEPGWRATINGEPYDVVLLAPDWISILVNGQSRTFRVGLEPGGPSGDPSRSRRMNVSSRGRSVGVERQDPRRGRRGPAAASTGPNRVFAPMAGRVIRRLAEPGDTVAADQPILILEAMKMQNELRSPRAGRIRSLPPRPGDAVAPGDLLAEIE